MTKLTKIPSNHSLTSISPSTSNESSSYTYQDELLYQIKQSDIVIKKLLKEINDARDFNGNPRLINQFLNKKTNQLHLTHITQSIHEQMFLTINYINAYIEKKSPKQSKNNFINFIGEYLNKKLVPLNPHPYSLFNQDLIKHSDYLLNTSIINKLPAKQQYEAIDAYIAKIFLDIFETEPSDIFINSLINTKENQPYHKIFYMLREAIKFSPLTKQLCLNHFFNVIKTQSHPVDQDKLINNLLLTMI